MTISLPFILVCLYAYLRVMTVATVQINTLKVGPGTKLLCLFVFLPLIGIAYETIYLLCFQALTNHFMGPEVVQFDIICLIELVVMRFESGSIAIMQQLVLLRDKITGREDGSK